MAEGFGSFKGFGEPQQDLSTSDGLLSFAQAQGGAVSQVATELAHPKTSILSTVSNGFKNAFSGFIDIISIPNQVVAGAISSKYTVGEAIKKNIATSDVLFGKKDPNASIYQKTGGFIARLATDVLLDPTTYLTFGTGAILKTGLKTTVVLKQEAAKAFGKEAFDTAFLSKIGKEAYDYVAKIGHQHDGTTAYKHIQTGNKMYDLAGDELEKVLSKTIDAPLDQDFARDTVSRMLESNPALVKDYLDKGGIKYFGQTILSAQRMKSAIEMVPGMSSLDVITEQPRKAIASLFSPNYTKLNSGLWVRVPGGITEMAQKYKDLVLAKQDNKMREISDVIKTFDLQDTEARFLLAAVENNMIPANAKLQAAYKHMLGYSEEDWTELVDNGMLAKETRLESFAPHLLVQNKMTSVTMKMPPSISTGATKERKMAKFVNPTTGQVQTGHAGELGLKRVLTIDEQDKIMKSINAVYEKTESNIAKTNKEIDQLAGVVRDVFNSKLSDTTKAILKNAPDLDKQNLKLFVQTVVNEAGDLNLDKLIKSYGSKNYQAGLKKTMTAGLKDMSYEAMALLKAKLDKSGKALPDDLMALNDFLKETLKKKVKPKTATKGGDTAGEVKQMMAKMKLHNESVTTSLVNENIDKEALASFVEGLKSAFIENPTGARKALEAIIGKKQQITNMLNELDISTLGAKADLFGLPVAKAVYKNSAGDVFTKEVAPIFNVRDAQMFEDIEQTLLRDPKAAAKMLDDIKQDGFEIFDDNLMTAWAARSLKNSKAVGMKQLLHDVAKNFGVEKEFASPNFVPIASENITKEAQNILSVMGKDSEMVFHPAVAAYIEKYASSMIGDDATMDFLKSYDKLQNFWKSSVTSVWPAFHGRNAISNVLQNYLGMGLAALDPRTHVVSMQLIYAQRHMGKLQREAIGEGRVAPVKSLDSFIEENDFVFQGVGTGKNSDFLTTNLGEANTYATQRGLEGTGEIRVFKYSELPEDLRTITEEDGMYDLVLEKFGKDFVNKPLTKQQYSKVRSAIGYNKDEIAKLKQVTSLKPDTTGLDTKRIFTELQEKSSPNVGNSQAQEQIAEISQQKFFTDAVGHEWSYGEIIQVAKNNNIAFTSRIVSQSDAAGGPEAIAESLFPAKTKKGKLARLAQAPGRIGQDVVGRTIEEQSRLVSFITNLKATGDVTMASRQTKQFLFDYSNLTNFERNVMRRILPFYTFTRKNLELQARALITTPGRIAAEVHAVSSLGEVISGGESLTDEERDKLPDWIKSGMTIMTKKNGSQVSILRNLGTPLEAPFQQMQANNMLGSVSPLLRVPVELGSGHNFFAGKPLSEVTNASAFQNAPAFLKNAIGFHTVTQEDGKKWNVALRPQVMHLILNLPPTPRVWSTLNTMQSQDLTTQEKTLAGLIGTKISTFDLEEEEMKKERKLRRQLEDLLTNAQVTAQFTRTYIPKTEAEKAQDAF